MSSASDRSRSRDRDRSRSKGRVDKHKMFITNLDGTAKEDELHTELEQLFSKHGTIKELSVKKSKNGDYSFAFVEYNQGEDATEAIRNLDGYLVKGKPMKVELQDDTKRRKDPDKGCYTCGKKGHFARECTSKNNSSYRGRRNRSRSSSRSDRGKRRRYRSESQSSQKRRSRTKKDKDRKQDKKKKHKKSRHRSSSDSDS